MRNPTRVGPLRPRGFGLGRERALLAIGHKGVLRARPSHARQAARRIDQTMRRRNSAVRVCCDHAQAGQRTPRSDGWSKVRSQVRVTSLSDGRLNAGARKSAGRAAWSPPCSFPRVGSHRSASLIPAAETRLPCRRGDSCLERAIHDAILGFIPEATRSRGGGVRPAGCCDGTGGGDP